MPFRHFTSSIPRHEVFIECDPACGLGRRCVVPHQSGQRRFFIYLSDYVQQELADDVPGETELGKKLRRGLGQIAGAAAEQLTHRQEWHLASVYTIEIAGDSKVFLGIAGQFLPVKSR